ncbi:NifB/NifX family molybdenum-iron cluster-binding protein [bacterium]|nr:NifB/NifX family molybdenum-iron cluster-binding protein [bacterium]
MRVGLTVWNGRISPVMDAAGELLVVECTDGGWEAVQRVPLGQAGHMRIARLIGTLGLDALVCGAVSRRFGAMLADQQMTLIAWVTGEVDTVLGALMNGTLQDECYRMPGCGRAGRGAGRRQRRSRGGGR